MVFDVGGDADLDGDGDTNDPHEVQTAPYDGGDIALSVFDTNGVHQWSKRIGGSDRDLWSSVAIDNEGNITIAGSVVDVADLNGDGDTIDPYETPDMLTGEHSVFITSFDATGTHRWSTRLMAPSAITYAVATNVLGDVIVAGEVQGDADLNGDGDTTDPHETQASPYGQTDIFISAFSSSSDHLWSKRLGGSGANDAGFAVVTDNDNNVFVTGKVIGTADLNGDGDTTDPHETQASPYGSVDVFVTSFDASGTHRWSTRLGGTDVDAGMAIASDQTGNVIVVGEIDYVLSGTNVGVVDLNGDGDTTDPNEVQTAPYDGSDIFVSIFSNTGTHIWSTRLGGVSNDRGRAVAVDANNRILLTGSIVGTADLNGDGDTTDPHETVVLPYGSNDIGLTVFSIYYDHTPPTLSLNSVTSGTNPVVTGTAGSASSTIFTVEYQVNGTSGAWSACTADDGAFDSASETFTCSVASGRSAGTYTAYVQSTDMNWNSTLGGSEASTSFTVSPPSSTRRGGGGSSSRTKETPATTATATTTRTSTATEKAVAPVTTTTRETPAVSSGTSNILTLVNLLVSLGIIPAEKATIARTLAMQKMGTPAQPTLPATFRFTQILKEGDTHPEVRALQQFLNSKGFTVTESGPGSLGNETNYFGPATRSAVSRLQEAYRAEILTPANFSAPTGMFGPNSIKKANALLAS